jgi:glycosyltransferase involved in cell wall biosynthesis
MVKTGSKALTLHKVTAMGKKKILFIGLVWPEPTSSAAGTRIIQLINSFLSNNYEVTFASAASKSDYSFNLAALGVTGQHISLNDSSFNIFLKTVQPDMVMFDRFMSEEQYGWRVTEACPQAIKILDTEDLHCLRYARQQAVKSSNNVQTINLYNDIAKREIASIYRCDLSLIISKTELDILTHDFKVPSNLLYYLPFTEQAIDGRQTVDWKDFDDREGFVFIGNYLHEPNWHTLQVLKTQIWPKLRRVLPDVKMHIYGAYSSSKVMQLHQEKEHFYVHGRAADAVETISKHRVMLAPIQFGAGLKGKFIDAMRSGTPIVTTTVGAEGMKEDLAWNGAIADDHEDFIHQAIAFYKKKDLWLMAQENGTIILNTLFVNTDQVKSFFELICRLSEQLNLHRQNNFIGQLLQHQSNNSSKYMSLWIEEKNKSK